MSRFVPCRAPLLLVGWLVPVVALGQPVAPPLLTEEAFVAAAVQDHPALAAVQARIRAVQSQAVRFSSLPPPGVRAIVSQIDPAGMMRPTVMLMAEQAIPLGNQRTAAAEAVQAAAAVQEVDSRTAMGLLKGAARLAFADWRGLHARRAVLGEDLKAIEHIVHILERQLAAGGLATVTRLARMHAEAEQVRVERDAVDAGLPLVRARLNALLARPVGSELAEPDLSIPALDLAEEPSGTQHPTLERLQREAAAGRARSRAEKAALSPTLMPGAGVMTMQDMPIGFMVTLGMTLPDFRPSVGRARIATGLAEAEAADLQALARSRDITAALAEAKARLVQLDVRRRGLRARVLPALRKVVDAAVPLLASGQGNAADIAESLRRLVTVDLQVVELDTQWLIARAGWLQAHEADPPGMAVMPVQMPASTGGMGDIGGMAGMGL
jgi:outer membrane protein TolC